MQECQAIKEVLRYVPGTNIVQAMLATDPQLFDYLNYRDEGL